MTATAKLGKLAGSAPHCSQCGEAADEGSDQGYSYCCNKRLCYSSGCPVVIFDPVGDGWTETAHFDSLPSAEAFKAEVLA
ncbi:MAG: hypothetical protein DRJ50_09055 [Actinobacteria bacterium]|nr:MAG: hypothetical protein DRJ50_09055 [Actinomycetota bacterium]